MKKSVEQQQLKCERVLEELAFAAFFDPLALFNEDGTLKEIRDIPEGTRRAIASFKVSEFSDKATGQRGVLKEVKLMKKESALTLAGRHLKLFSEKAAATDIQFAEGEVTQLDLSRLDDAELDTLRELVRKASYPKGLCG